MASQLYRSCILFSLATAKDLFAVIFLTLRQNVLFNESSARKKITTHPWFAMQNY
jgi:hypothetical protein